jgi:hypothetical protein
MHDVTYFFDTVGLEILYDYSDEIKFVVTGKDIEKYGDEELMKAIRYACSYKQAILDIECIREWNDYDEDALARVELIASSDAHPLCSIAKSALDRIKPVEETEHKKKAKKKDGWVYVLFCMGRYKIGVTTQSVHDRVSAIARGLPSEPQLVTTIKTQDCYGLESTLHDRYGGKRLKGEWFALSNEDVEYIKEIAIGEQL